MQQATLALVLGLFAGLGGGLLAGILTGPRGGAWEGRDLDTAAHDLTARVEALEDRLDADRAPRLKGIASEGGGSTAIPREAIEASVGEIARAQLRNDPELAALIREKVEEATREKTEASDRGRTRARLSLREAAAEIGLSASEEDALRRIYAEREQGMLRVLAGEDGDVEEVRRDIQRAVQDEARRPELAQKYMPRVVGNLEEVMKIEMTKRAAITSTVGPEKARKLRGMSIEEEDPMGLRGSMRVGGAVESDR